MRVLQFLGRHGWSFPLSVLSVLCFVQLAFEVHARELAPFDQWMANLLVAERGGWDAVMLALTRVGGGRGMAVLCICAVLVLMALKQRKPAVFTALCGLGALGLTMGLKLLFQRARPEAAVQYLIAAPSSFSFPSGHALGSTGVVGGLVVLAFALRVGLLWRVMITCLGVAFILGVGASRVYFGVHYPSDVLGGQLAGAAWVSAVTGWLYPRLLPGEASETKLAPEQLEL